jgi:hypothetical protein
MAGEGKGTRLKARAGPGLRTVLKARTCSLSRREELARRWADRLGPRSVTAMRTWVRRQLVERLVMDTQTSLMEE